MKLFVVLSLIATMTLTLGCFRKPEAVSIIQSMPIQSGILTASDTGDFSGSVVSYNVYKSGLITMGGLLKFSLPGMGEFHVPVNRHYYAKPNQIKSASYIAAEANAIDIRRVSIKQSTFDDQTMLADYDITDIRTTHFTDDFYGAQDVHFTLDLSNEYIKVKSIEIVNGWTFWQSQNRSFNIEMSSSN